MAVESPPQSLFSRLKERVATIRELSQKRSYREAFAGIMFVLPFLTLFTIFTVYALGFGLYISLWDWSPIFTDQSEFIWFDNYARMFGDPLFWLSLRNSAIWTALMLPLVIGLPLILALAVAKDIRGKWLLRTIFFSPSMLTVAVVALIWSQLYDPNYGPLNYYLGFFMENPPNWLLSHEYALPALVIAAVWGGIGTNFVIFIAARQGIPESLYEAARIDGAKSYHAFRDITIPQMKHPLLFVMVTSLIGTFQVFEIIYIMTGGGPANRTNTIVLYLYQAGFENQQFGYGAAIGYVLFAILVTVSIANYYLLEHYASRVEGEVAEGETNE